MKTRLLVVLLLLLTGISAAADSDCERALISYKFVDYQKLETLPVNALITRHYELEGDVTSLIRRLSGVEAELADKRRLSVEFVARIDGSFSPVEILRQHLAYEKSIELSVTAEERFALQADLQALLQHIARLKRVIQRRFTGGANPYARKFAIDIKLKTGQKTPWEVAEQIQADLIYAGIKPEDTILRYFGAPREDVVRLYGTDRAGDEAHHENDPYNLIPYLMKIGLKRDEGFYGGTFQDLLDHQSLPYYPAIHELMAGRQCLAIYRADKVEPSPYDFFIFSYPNRKFDALLGLVCPTLGIR